MTLATGTKLGSYEIHAAIGAGGMGEVYRARDAKLGRDVALKVLPEAFARDSERMVRFQREAKLLASLNHPNIAAIYGFEDSGTTHALVMEPVEGPTLAEKISGSAARTSQTPAGLPGPSATGTQSARKPGATQDLPPEIYLLAARAPYESGDFGANRQPTICGHLTDLGLNT
ncbi:MAG: protein kinase domain-containing protein [Terriglobia bacterium]